MATTAKNSRLAVLFLDVDRFHLVNETLGHPGGDAVLAQVAERLGKSLRFADVLSRHGNVRTELSRLGGDEFSALLTGVTEEREVAGIIERLQRSLRRPIKVGDKECSITASVGASLYPADGRDAETLLANAQSAMYSSRNLSCGGHHFYSSDMRSGVSERVALEADLRQAVDRGQFVLHYQPTMRVDKQRISGAEALVRWNHPLKGIVSPATFIPIAEEAGFVDTIGTWVLREVGEQAAAWREAGFAPIRIAVNLSSAQFRMDNLLETVATALNDSLLEPRYLAVEVTESMIMRDASGARDILDKLRDLGVHVSLDDFGTGYSTLSTLKDLPLDCLKIDRAFITHLPTSKADVAIVRAVISMAHGLGFSVVAEGVESNEQLSFLREEGCDEIQGYLISRAVPADAFSEMLQKTVDTPSVPT